MNNEQVLLVDYENIGKIDLSALPSGVRVPFFFGASQKSVPTDFLRAALKLGERFIPIDIAGQGKNALDFHIAYYLGVYLTRDPRAPCIILSRDKGFDPLVKHLVLAGHDVRRAATLADAFPPGRASDPPARGASGGRGRGRGRQGAASATAPQPAVPAPVGASTPYDVALAWLKSMPKKNRPLRRKGLAASLYSHFSRKHSEGDVQFIVEQLITSGVLEDNGGKISYRI